MYADAPHPTRIGPEADEALYTRAYVPGARHISELMQVPDALLLPLVEAHAPQGIKLESYRWGILESSAADLPRHLEAAARWIDDRHQHGVNVLLYL